MILKTILSFLKTKTTITAVISNRIFMLKIKEGEPMPCISFNLSGNRGYNVQGRACKEFLANLQIDVWAESVQEVENLATITRKAIDNGNYLGDTVNIKSVRFVSEIDSYEPESGDFRKIQDYEVFYSEIA